MNWIDREGNFRGHCIGARAVTGADGAQSVGLELDYQIDEALNAAHEWEDWSTYSMVVRGTLWIIKRDGGINDRAAETARDVLGWNGDFAIVKPETFAKCQLNVKGEVYNNKERFRVAFFNPWDHDGGSKTLDDAAIAQIARVNGAKLRAFFGAKKTAAQVPPPTTPPKAPPPPAVSASLLGQAAVWKLCLDLNPGDQKKAEMVYIKALDSVMKATGKRDADFTADDWKQVAELAELPF